MKIKGIIFDLDGTLLYTLEDLKNSVNYSLEKLNLKPVTLEETRKYVGNGILNLIKRATGEDKEYVEECLKLFKEHYSKNLTANTKPYPGILKTLKQLKEKNIKLAVLSNKLDTMVKSLTEYYFKGIFDFVSGETDEFPKKPDSKSSKSIIRQFGLKNEEVLFVGDSEVDILTAKNTGLTCISVTWGYKSRDFLSKNGAEHIIESPKEILKYVTSCK